jgi:hypothetical protein
MKNYILSIEKRFPEFHKLSNQPTFYKKLILEGHKIHTIRTKIEYWTNIITKINNKEGYLSLREWEGKEYESKSTEFLKVYKCGLEIIQKTNGKWTLINSGTIIDEFHLAENDGLSLRSLNYYYPNPNSFPMIIIHFTDFRYENESMPIFNLTKPIINPGQQLNIDIFK